MSSARVGEVMVGDCIALMARFIREKPELWNEDIMEGD